MLSTVQVPSAANRKRTPLRLQLRACEAVVYDLLQPFTACLSIRSDSTTPHIAAIMGSAEYDSLPVRQLSDLIRDERVVVSSEE